MNRSILSKRVAAAALGLAALAAASAAQARSDVYFSIGVQPSHVYVQPAPVYVQPQPVYVQPGYGYHGGHPRRGPWGDRDRDGIPNIHDRYDNRQHWSHARRHGGWGDADRDGVPNRHDRRPNNPYRY